MATLFVLVTISMPHRQGQQSKGAKCCFLLGSRVQMTNVMASFRDKSIDKWQRKTQVTSGAAAIKGKLQAFNQDISQQVAGYMRDPSKMIKGMQQSRSAVALFGTLVLIYVPASVQVPDATGNGEGTNMDGDPELLDDSDFYQQLLKEFFEAVDPASSETAFYALKRLQTKKRKIVDRRASKSRKIRYNIHEKIVNFMAPQPMNLPEVAPKLFENLFAEVNENQAAKVNQGGVWECFQGAGSGRMEAEENKGAEDPKGCAYTFNATAIISSLQ
ncbi:hypothetical protein BC332_01628 [Capsicum chinense]|nr:hypothetical protein BC332_01628 [Capsicum chinense]